MISTEIVLGSFFLGLLSSPISIVKKPRFFWGSAAFDPISFLWMISFFLYGPVGALMSSIIGSLSIALFSKEATPMLGAILKFIGTFTVWITLYFVVIFASDGLPSAMVLNNLGIYAFSVFLAAILRCVIEIPACYFAIPYFLTRSTKVSVSAQSMLEKFGGFIKYFLIMITLNFYLTFLDAFFSWLLVYPTGIYAKFAVW